MFALRKSMTRAMCFYRFQNLQGNVFSFEQIPNEFTVCVTKDGFVPYCVNVLKQDDGNLYLQNVTFDGNTTVVGKNHSW